MHIRSMHNKRVHMHPLFTLPGQIWPRLYISGECARLCLHRRERSSGRVLCVCARARVFLFFTSSFSVFLFLVLSRWGGVSLNRDDFRGVLFRPRSTRSLSYRILASRIAPAELVFSEFFVVSGEEIRLDFEGRENLGRGI